MAFKNEKSAVVQKYSSSFNLIPDYAIKDSVMYSDRLPGNAFLLNFVLEYSDLFQSAFMTNANEIINYQITSATLLPNLCGTLSMLFLFLIFFKVFKVTFSTSIMLMLVGGFCTLMMQESIHLFSHAPSILLIISTVYFCFKKKENLKKSDWYIIAALIGFATCLELQNVLFIVPISLYFMSSDANSKPYTTIVNRQSVLLSTLILLTFISCVVAYNYWAFGEIMLKSNKYNPFYPEERSFLTSLSGNPLIGLDQLFTSFNNIEANWNWSVGTKNATPGLFPSSPIYLLACLGFIPMLKQYKKEALLLMAIILTSVLIAATHKTTLVRHISSVYLLLFIPIAFLIKEISNRESRSKIFLSYFVFGTICIYSFFKVMYITNHYYSRDFSFFEFPYLKNTTLFFAFNAPLLLVLILVKTTWNYWSLNNKKQLK